MKAISLWQPWASLWVRGRKAYETRHWATDYRGPLLIHAAKTLCADVSAELQEILDDEFGHRWAGELPRGALIGYCELISCVPTENVHIDADERAQGNFTQGRFAWGNQNAREFNIALPWRGRQGFFDVPDDIVASIDPDLIKPGQARFL